MSGVNLKAERLNRGLTTTQVAGEVGCNRATIERAESGATVPRPATAKAIAEFYGHRVTDIWPVDPAHGFANNRPRAVAAAGGMDERG